MSRTLLLLALFLLPIYACDLPGVNGTPPPNPTLTTYDAPTLPAPRLVVTVLPLSIQAAYVEPSDTTLVVVTHTPEAQFVLIGDGDYSVHIVQEGDTFYTLAGEYCGDVHQYPYLLALNRMTEESVLEVGSRVVIDCQ